MYHKKHESGTGFEASPHFTRLFGSHLSGASLCASAPSMGRSRLLGPTRRAASLLRLRALHGAVPSLPPPSLFLSLRCGQSVGPACRSLALIWRIRWSSFYAGVVGGWWNDRSLSRLSLDHPLCLLPIFVLFLFFFTP